MEFPERSVTLLPSVSPQYIRCGDTITFECVVNDRISDYTYIAVEVRNRNTSFHKKVIISPGANQSFVHQPHEISMTGNNRFKFSINATNEASGLYYCIYVGYFRLRRTSNTIEIVMQGKLHAHHHQDIKFAQHVFVSIHLQPDN